MASVFRDVLDLPSRRPESEAGLNPGVRAITPPLVIVAQVPTQSLAALNRLLVVADVRVTRKQQNVTLPLVIAFSMIMFDVFAQGPPQRALAKRITFDKHSTFTDRTQRSAYAFKFGLRAGSASGSTRPEIMMARNDRLYFVSRSCRR